MDKALDSSLQTEIDLALQACSISPNGNAIRRIIANLFEQNREKQFVLFQHLIEELAVLAFGNRNYNGNGDINPNIESDKGNESRNEFQSYGIRPLPVTSPSQITINKLSVSSHSVRRNIALPSRKELKQNDSSDDSGSDIPSSSSSGNSHRDEGYYDAIDSENNATFDKATSNKLLAEAAWKEAMMKSLVDDEEDNDADSSRDFTHYDLFKQLKRKTNNGTKRSRSVPGSNASNFTTSGDNTKSSPGNNMQSNAGAIDGMLKHVPYAINTEMTSNDDESEPVRNVGVYNPSQGCMLEEEEEDYEAPTYATPLQAVPPPPLSMYSVSSSTIGRPRKGTARSSRMKKRNSSTTSTGAGGTPTSSANNKRQVTPKKESNSITVTSGASITNTTLAVDSPTHSTYIQHSPGKPDKAIKVDDIISRANHVLADIEKSVHRTQYHSPIKPSETVVSKADEVVLEIEAIKAAAATRATAALSDSEPWDVDQDIVLSDDEDDGIDSDEAEMLLYTTNYDMVENIFFDVLNEIKTGDNYDTERTITKSMLSQISDNILISLQKESSAKVEGLDLAPILEMFQGTNIADRDNVALMIHIIAKCVVDNQKRDLHQRKRSEDEDISEMITIPVPAGYAAYRNYSLDDSLKIEKTAEQILSFNGLLDSVNALPSKFGVHNANNNHAMDASDLISDTSSVSTEANNNRLSRFSSDGLEHFKFDDNGDSDTSTPVHYHNDEQLLGSDVDDVDGMDVSNGIAIDSNVSTPKQYHHSAGCSGESADGGDDRDDSSHENSDVSTPQKYHTNTSKTINAAVASLGQWKSNRSIVSDIEDEEDDPSRENPDRNDPDAPWNIPQSPMDKIFRTGVGGIGRPADVSHLVISHEDEDKDIVNEMYLSNQDSSPRSASVTRGKKSEQSPMSFAMSRKIKPEALHAVLTSPTAAYMGYVPSTTSSVSSTTGSNDGLGTPPTPVINTVKNFRHSIILDDSPDIANHTAEENYITVDDLPPNFGMKGGKNSNYSINPNYSLNPRKGWVAVENDEDTEEPDGEGIYNEDECVAAAPMNSGTISWDQILSDSSDNNVDSQFDDFTKTRDISSYLQSTTGSHKASNYPVFNSSVSLGTSTPASTTSPSNSFVGTDQILIKDEKGRVARIVSPSSSVDQWDTGYGLPVPLSHSGHSPLSRSPRKEYQVNQQSFYSDVRDETEVNETAASAAFNLLQRALLQGGSLNARREMVDIYQQPGGEAEEAVFHAEEYSDGGAVDDDISPEAHPVIRGVNIVPPRDIFVGKPEIQNELKSSLKFVQDQYGSAPIANRDDMARKTKKPRTNRSSLLTLSPAKLNSGNYKNKLIGSKNAKSGVSRNYASASPILSPNTSAGSGQLFQEFDDSDISSSEADSNSNASDSLLRYGTYSEEEEEEEEDVDTNKHETNNLNKENNNDDYYWVRSNPVTQINEVNVNIINYDRDEVTDDEESENDTDMATRDLDNQTAEYTIATTVSDDVQSYGSSTRGISYVTSYLPPQMDEEMEVDDEDDDDDAISPNGERFVEYNFGGYDKSNQPSVVTFKSESASETDDSDEGIEDQYIAPEHYDHYSNLELNSSPMNTSIESLKYFAFRKELEGEYNLNQSMNKQDNERNMKAVNQYIQKDKKVSKPKAIVKRKPAAVDGAVEKKKPPVRRKKPAVVRSQDDADVGSYDVEEESDEENNIMKDLYRKAVSKKEYVRLFGETAPQTRRPKSAPTKRKTKKAKKVVDDVGQQTLVETSDYQDAEPTFLPPSYGKNDQPEISVDTVTLRLKSALQSLKNVGRSEWAEIRSMNCPPVQVGMVMAAICILMGVDPLWSMSKWLLSQPHFVHMLINIDVDNIPKKIMDKIKKEYFNNEYLTPEILRKVSKPVSLICEWLHGLVMYDSLIRDIRESNPMHTIHGDAVSDGRDAKPTKSKTNKSLESKDFSQVTRKGSKSKMSQSFDTPTASSALKQQSSMNANPLSTLLRR